MTYAQARGWLRDYWLVAGLLAFILLALAVFFTGDVFATRIGGLLLVAVGHLFFLGSLRHKRLAQGTSIEARLWQFLAVTALMWAFARLFQAGHIVIRGSLPSVPSLAEFALLAGALAAVGSVVRDPFPLNPHKGGARDLLEVAVIGVGAIVLFWLAVVLPAMEVGFESPVSVAWLGLAPGFDLVLVVLYLRLLFLNPGRNARLILGLLAAGFLVRLSADLALAYELLRGAQTAPAAVELGWLFSPLSMTLAARFRAGATLAEPARPARSLESFGQRVGNLMPLALTCLVGGFTLASWWLVGALSWVGAVTTAGLALLLVARQGVIAGQAEMRQYATLVEGAADLAFVSDASGELLLSNPSLEQIIGRTGGASAPVQLKDFLQGPPEPDAMLASALEEGWSGEVYFRSQRGEEIPVALSLRPVLDERRSEPVLAGTAHDLTQLKRREGELERALQQVAQARAELQQLNQSLEAKVDERTEELEATVERLERLNEELKELDRLKSEFVTLVSHELRAPLTNIRSGVELLLQGSTELQPSVEETLELVGSETERLVDFVEIILDLSALEAGRFPLSPEPLELAPLARTVADRFPAQGGAGRIVLDVAEELPRVRADERSVMSVLFHLLDNALKYAPQGPVRVQAQEQDEGVRIAVSDQGPGVAPGDREAVFDRFHRLDTSDAREVYGRGLGLYLCRRLIEAMEGDIGVFDSDSGGAEFAFWLPRDGP